MTKTEQYKIIEALREYEHKLRGKELDDFEMMRKRDRDDEELDDMTRHRLMELYVKYVPERFR
jgi:hypothetical protein